MAAVITPAVVAAAIVTLLAASVVALVTAAIVTLLAAALVITPPIFTVIPVTAPPSITVVTIAAPPIFTIIPVTAPPIITVVTIAVPAKACQRDLVETHGKTLRRHGARAKELSFHAHSPCNLRPEGWLYG